MVKKVSIIKKYHPLSIIEIIQSKFSVLQKIGILAVIKKNIRSGYFLYSTG